MVAISAAIDHSFSSRTNCSERAFCAPKNTDGPQVPETPPSFSAPLLGSDRTNPIISNLSKSEEVPNQSNPRSYDPVKGLAESETDAQSREARDEAIREVQEARVRKEILERLAQKQNISSTPNNFADNSEEGAIDSARAQNETRVVQERQKKAQEAREQELQAAELRKQTLELIQDGKPVSEQAALDRINQSKAAKALAREEEERAQSAKEIFQNVQDKLANIFKSESNLPFVGKRANLQA